MVGAGFGVGDAVGDVGGGLRGFARGEGGSVGFVGHGDSRLIVQQNIRTQLCHKVFLGCLENVCRR